MNFWCLSQRVQLRTWSPNKLWRSNSIWPYLTNAIIFYEVQLSQPQGRGQISSSGSWRGPTLGWVRIGARVCARVSVEVRFTAIGLKGQSHEIFDFLKKIEMILILISGAWGKEIFQEKNLKQKISWHCPFKRGWHKVSWRVRIRLG